MRSRAITDPQLEATLVNLQLVKMAGVVDDPYEEFVASLGLSPTDGGRDAQRFISDQRRRLLGRAIKNLMRPPEVAPLPEVDEKTAIRIGLIREGRR